MAPPTPPYAHTAPASDARQKEREEKGEAISRNKEVHEDSSVKYRAGGVKAPIGNMHARRS